MAGDYGLFPPEGIPGSPTERVMIPLLETLKSYDRPSLSADLPAEINLSGRVYARVEAAVETFRRGQLERPLMHPPPSEEEKQ